MVCIGNESQNSYLFHPFQLYLESETFDEVPRREAVSWKSTL